MINIGDYIEDRMNGGAPPLLGWVEVIEDKWVIYRIDKLNSSRAWRNDPSVHEKGRPENLIVRRTANLVHAGNEAEYYAAVTEES